MKKRITIKRSLLTLIAAVLSLTASAQLREDAFIIRTTDGAAQGLLFGDVEKITFSNLDDEGVPHTGVYYQELHYPDTIIRVPVSEVNEVSFEKPKMKFQSNVIDCKETGLISWFESRVEEKEEGFELTFYNDTPEELLPKPGQIITYFDVDKSATGYKPFACRVKSIEERTGNDFWATKYYYCIGERLESIQDIYEEIVGVDALEDDSPGVQEALRRAGMMPRAPMRIEMEGQKSARIPFDIPIGFDLSDEDENDDPNLSSDRSLSFHGGVNGSVGVRLTYEFTKYKTYLGLVTDFEYTPYFKAEVSANGTWEKKWPKNPAIDQPIIKFVPPSAPFFTINLGAGLFVKFAGSAKLALQKTFPTNRTRYFSYYDDGEYKSGSRNINQSKEYKNLDNEGDFSFTISLEGSAMFGPYIGIFAGTDIFRAINIGILGEMYAGPKFSGTIAFSPTMQEGNGPNTVGYGLMKDCNVTYSLCSVDMALSYYNRIGDDETKKTFASLSFDINPHTYSLLPEFEAPTWKMANKSDYYNDDLSLIDLPMKVTAPKPDGTWLLPVKYGYAIYRENGSFIESKYSDNYYFSWKGQEDDPAEAEAILGETKQWIPGQKYKLYPAFKLLGFDRKEYEFRAEPARNETPAEDAKVHTGDYEIVYDPIEPYALLYGSLDEEIIMSPRFATCNFEYTTDPNFGENSWHNLNAVKGKGDKQTQYKTTERLNGLKTSTTYYYRLRADYFDLGEHTYGEIKSFKTPKSFSEEDDNE